MRMSQKLSGWILLGFLAGCSGPANTPVTSAPAANPPAATGGSIGTLGGGGTLVFTLKQAAVIAHKVMEAETRVGTLPGDGPLAIYYARHRDAWMKSLKDVSEKTDLVTETNDPLVEKGVTKGAKVVMHGVSPRLYLNVPYLTTSDGFPERKAFATAIHEAGHLANPDMTDQEHEYLDQVASLLYARRPAPSLHTPKLVTKIPGYIDNFEVSSDGRLLSVELLAANELLTVDLETGAQRTEWPDSSLYPHGWIRLVKGSGEWVIRTVQDGYQLNNQRTNERLQWKLPGGIISAYQLKDGSTIAILFKNGQLCLKNRLTGQEVWRAIEVEGLPYRTFDVNFDWQATVFDSEVFTLFDLNKRMPIDALSMNRSEDRYISATHLLSEHGLVLLNTYRQTYGPNAPSPTYDFLVRDVVRRETKSFPAENFVYVTEDASRVVTRSRDGENTLLKVRGLPSLELVNTVTYPSSKLVFHPVINQEQEFVLSEGLDALKVGNLTHSSLRPVVLPPTVSPVSWSLRKVYSTHAGRLYFTTHSETNRGANMEHVTVLTTIRAD
jgi:hypothetical protein